MEERQKVVTEAVNDFAGIIQSALHSVDGAAVDLQAMAKSLGDSTTLTTNTARTVTDASQQATSNVHAVAAATDQLFASIVEISNQVQQSKGISGQAVTEARNADGSVQGLALAAEKIGDVVKLINAIAEQTNLLALNETIEAARAGEAGESATNLLVAANELTRRTTLVRQEIETFLKRVTAG